MSKTVLVVDDEPLIVEELQDAIEYEGMEVTTAGSAMEALTILETQSFDMIVTDLKLPNMSGLDFLAELKKRGTKSKAIVLSGHGAQSSKSEAKALGAIACFAKPVDTDELIRKIRLTRSV